LVCFHCGGGSWRGVRGLPVGGELDLVVRSAYLQYCKSGLTGCVRVLMAATYRCGEGSV
jgi:hypothetical protein